jgi:hypothetical protein
MWPRIEPPSSPSPSAASIALLTPTPAWRPSALNSEDAPCGCCALRPSAPDQQGQRRRDGGLRLRLRNPELLADAGDVARPANVNRDRQ